MMQKDEASGLMDLLESVEPSACEHFVPVLRDALAQGNLVGDTHATKGVLQACALVLRPAEATPFIPRFEGASTPAELFRLEVLEEMDAAVEETCAELRARVYDLVWVLRRDAEKGRLAIREYVASARVLASQDKGAFYARDNLLRAAAMASRMKLDDELDKVRRASLELLSSEDATTSARMAIARLMIDNEQGDANAIAEQVRPILEAQEAACARNDAPFDWEWLRHLWKLLADAERLAGREVQSNEAASDVSRSRRCRRSFGSSRARR